MWRLFPRSYSIIGWSELQACQLVRAVLRRVAVDLFWGFVDPSNVKTASVTGRAWWEVFGKMETKRARAVRGRLYRSHWAMQNYHRHAIDGGRNVLLNKRT
jgi:hypothetical protein